MAGPSSIPINTDTNNPTEAWRKMYGQQIVIPVSPLPFHPPVDDKHVRFVCISDTHSRHVKPHVLPPGDVLLHAGDFTLRGGYDEVQKFNEFLGSLPYKHKIVIAGNHDIPFDEFRTFFGSPNSSRISIKTLLTNCIYLEDSEVQIWGIKIYGSPWVPEFGSWAFSLPRGLRLLEKWNKIPEGVDILMTHGPPIGHGDDTISGIKAGCVELLSTVQNRVKPKYHVFGHIHEAYGITTDTQTIFINASMCDIRYFCKNSPIIFDLPLPSGYTKQ